jgi:pimeloyl-ACP methyl ester carboxylesterase
MRLTPEQTKIWRDAKRDLLLPIVYVRGFAMTGGEIEDTTSDPFNGFNVGSMVLRTGWTGDTARHIFESPVLRLTQPPYEYRLAFSNGMSGLDPETHDELRHWADALAGQPSSTAAAPSAPSSLAVLAIYRYYDVDSRLLGTGRRAGMEAYGWGLGRLILDLLDATRAPGVHLVAHSMGGLVARTFLQNQTVLDKNSPLDPERTAAVQALIDRGLRPISQADWDKARASVRSFFTYGTPHNGITGQGGLGNWLLSPADAVLGLELDNFSQPRMLQYLDQPQGQPPNSLAGRFPVERTFCLVGTASADYPAAGGMSRRLVGQLSDGLVEIDNAIACGPPFQPAPGAPSSVLAARAYVRRAHSGPYGMVNSEEGFGNLSRFLFGNARVDGDLVLQTIDLPKALSDQRDAKRAAGERLDIRASYTFETSLRVRGERWAMTERVARDVSAIFRRYDELFPEDDTPFALTAEQEQAKEWHRRVELFSVFLDTCLRTLDEDPEDVAGRKVAHTMGFALRLRVAVPDYEVGGRLWRTNHYEGSALYDQDLVFLAFPDTGLPGGWGLAWGRNLADGTNDQMRFVTQLPVAAPGDDVGDEAFIRPLPLEHAVEFWLPLREDGPPRFAGWLRLTARNWNEDATPAPQASGAAPASL